MKFDSLTKPVSGPAEDLLDMINIFGYHYLLDNLKALGTVELIYKDALQGNDTLAETLKRAKSLYPEINLINFFFELTEDKFETPYNTNEHQVEVAILNAIYRTVKYERSRPPKPRSAVAPLAEESLTIKDEDKFSVDDLNGNTLSMVLGKITSIDFNGDEEEEKIKNTLTSFATYLKDKDLTRQLLTMSMTIYNTEFNSFERENRPSVSLVELDNLNKSYDNYCKANNIRFK